MIMDYELTGETPLQAAFDALCGAAKAIDIVPEGCFSPRGAKPGRVYLAVPASLSVDAVVDHLNEARLPLRLTLIHPTDEQAEDDSGDEDDD